MMTRIVETIEIEVIGREIGLIEGEESRYLQPFFYSYVNVPAYALVY